MNRATRTIISVVGVILAIGGLSHGFFETLQGNQATQGWVIEAIAPDLQQWQYGTEPAFTVMPTYLTAGIATMIVGTAMIVWSMLYMHTHHAATVFLLLFLLLWLVGGGIVQVVFFVLAWLVATRINQPLSFWRRVLPKWSRPALGLLWPLTTLVFAVLFLLALFIVIFGTIPGVVVASEAALLTWVFVMLGGAFVSLILSALSGFAYDIWRMDATERQAPRKDAPDWMLAPE